MPYLFIIAVITNKLKLENSFTKYTYIIMNIGVVNEHPKIKWISIVTTLRYTR
jgi:hypothetical protein